MCADESGQQGVKAPKTFSCHSEIAQGPFTTVDCVAWEAE